MIRRHHDPSDRMLRLAEARAVRVARTVERILEAERGRLAAAQAAAADAVPVDLMPPARPPERPTLGDAALFVATAVLLTWVFGQMIIGLIDAIPVLPTPAAHGSGSQLPPPPAANRVDRAGELESGSLSIPDQGRLASMPSVGIARGIAPRDAPTTSEAAVARRSATTNGERRPTTPGRAGSQPGVTPGRDPGLETHQPNIRGDKR